MTAVRVEWLTIAGEPDRWRSIGLTVTDAGVVPLFGTCLRIVSPTGDDSGGIIEWALSGPVRFSADLVPESGTGAAQNRTGQRIDGLATDVVTSADPVYADHALGAHALDHVVVLTPDMQRTSSAMAEATGFELRRIRSVDLGDGATMRQGFHRIGESGAGGLIVELVERPGVPSGPAQFWGLVLIVDDLDAACELLGPDRIGPPKNAVQPGRRIATVRGDVGLGVPVALMTP